LLNSTINQITNRKSVANNTQLQMSHQHNGRLSQTQNQWKDSGHIITLHATNISIPA